MYGMEWDFGLFLICLGIALICSVIFTVFSALTYWVISTLTERQRKKEGITHKEH